jgi:hypothetical protein
MRGEGNITHLNSSIRHDDLVFIRHPGQETHSDRFKRLNCEFSRQDIELESKRLE